MHSLPLHMNNEDPMESHVISEWCSEWGALTDEFEGQFTDDKSHLREYIKQIRSLSQIGNAELQPVRPINITLVFELEITCLQHSNEWDYTGYRLELKFSAADGSSRTHRCDLKPGERQKFELVDPCERVTLYLTRKRRLDEVTGATSALITRFLPEKAAKALYERDYVTVRVLAEHLLSELLSQDETTQESETVIDDGANGSTTLRNSYRLRRRSSPNSVIVHQQMASYLAINRQTRHGCMLVDTEAAILLKMHAHRYTIPRSRRAHIYLVVAVEAKLGGVYVPFAYLRENLRALCNDIVPPDLNERLLHLSKCALLDGLKTEDWPEDEEVLSTTVCYFEAARRVAANTSIATSLLEDVGEKLREIFAPAAISTVEQLRVTLERLCRWTQIMDKVCPKYGGGKVSLLLANDLQDFVLPRARTVLCASLDDFSKHPTLASDIVEVISTLTRLSQLTPIDDDFRLWFTDDQTRDLISAILRSDRERLLLQIGALTDTHQEFADRLRECMKRCEHFVDAFMWRYVAIASVFCLELCAVLQALRARLWSVQKDAPILRYCVQINALREIAFACDEMRAFLRLGSTGLKPEFEVAIREVQLKVTASQSALVMRLSANMLRSRDTGQSVADMVQNLEGASSFVASVNPHDRPKLVTCLWKIFLFRIMKRQQTSSNAIGDGPVIESTMSASVGEFIEKLFEMCPHLEPTDLEVR